MNNETYIHTFYAMGSQMTAWLTLDDAGLANEKLRQVKSLFQAAEKRLSRFQTTGELSRLNAQPGRWVKVSRVLWDVVSKALRLARDTEGLFDPTILKALEAAGYRSSFPWLEEPAADFDQTPPHDWDSGT